MRRIVTTVVATALLTSWSGARGHTAANPLQARWPLFYHSTGAYYVGFDDNIDEIVTAAGLGLSLTKTDYHPPGSRFDVALAAYHMKYIDDFPWREIEYYYGRSCPGYPRMGCTMSPTDEAALEQAVAAHLAFVRNDATIAGFYVLDDYPGPIEPTLLAIHSLVVAANKTSPFPRATVCAFGAGLDYKRSTGDRSFVPNNATFDRAITNYSPNACDVFALYPYGSYSSNDSSAVDWSMRRELPYMLHQFAKRGWNPATQPYLGIPQAFGDGWTPGQKGIWQYIVPRASDVATQTQAFCKGGASGILSFVWHYSGSKQESFPHELYNTPSLRQGLNTGLKACAAYWSRAGGRNQTPQ